MGKMKSKTVGMFMMIVSIILFITNMFHLNETPLGYTSMTFEHSIITASIGYLIMVTPETKQRDEVEDELER